MGKDLELEFSELELSIINQAIMISGNSFRNIIRNEIVSKASNIVSEYLKASLSDIRNEVKSNEVKNESNKKCKESEKPNHYTRNNDLDEPWKQKIVEFLRENAEHEYSCYYLLNLIGVSESLRYKWSKKLGHFLGGFDNIIKMKDQKRGGTWYTWVD